ncbi:uncharacterized protein Z518_06787 [Rhinocladiella mackenziei CBS 650.93]|uniref:Clr5 domain-containing protein n=1 Tax=Rhinocladiella mackenziei CBS 650.93 TaxID=1442369 RepID=A0A0D2J2Q7_9EURO|nr:uncharacterized protein Z518_06787 [Rhinocladiella mackenziei CBS 650.93]KIX03235.1 hypothetical protein Z518_06787 [Rhinocladiella mackenziei CBS 650.93]
MAQVTSASRAGRIREEEWERHRGYIQFLYLDLKLDLQKVMEMLKSKHGFCATDKQYKRQFAKWDLRKNITSKEMNALLNDQTASHIVRGSPVPLHKINRYARRHGLKPATRHCSPSLNPNAIASAPGAESSGPKFFQRLHCQKELVVELEKPSPSQRRLSAFAKVQAFSHQRLIIACKFLDAIQHRKIPVSEGPLLSLDSFLDRRVILFTALKFAKQYLEGWQEYDWTTDYSLDLLLEPEFSDKVATLERKLGNLNTIDKNFDPDEPSVPEYFSTCFDYSGYVIVTSTPREL